MTTYIALLRGINVGGRNMVPMAALRKLFVDLGLDNVKTLLQSGNVVFRTQESSLEKLETLLKTNIERTFRSSVDVFVRTVEQWGSVIRANPFPDAAAADPSHLVVVFLRDPLDLPSVEAVRALVKGREVFRSVGNHLYVVYPDGIGDSKLARTPGWNKLAAHGTARNWNTVLKLAAMSSESD